MSLRALRKLRKEKNTCYLAAIRLQHLLLATEFVNTSFVVVQSLSPVQTLCDPVDCSTPGFPVLHQLPELSQTHVL